MIKVLIYMETVILMTLFLLIWWPIRTIFVGILKFIKALHQTSDFYSENDIHFYQPRKARDVYNKLFIDKVKQMEKK